MWGEAIDGGAQRRDDGWEGLFGPGGPASSPVPQPEGVITRSARRRKTLSARWVDGVVKVAVPAGMSPQAEADAVHALVQKMVRRRANEADQGALERRAHRLNRSYFEGLATPAEIRSGAR